VNQEEGEQNEVHCRYTADISSQYIERAYIYCDFISQEFL